MFGREVLPFKLYQAPCNKRKYLLERESTNLLGLKYVVESLHIVAVLISFTFNT